MTISKLGHYIDRLKLSLSGKSSVYATKKYCDYLRERFEFFLGQVVQGKEDECWKYLGSSGNFTITNMQGALVVLRPQVLAYCLANMVSPFSLKQEVISGCDNPSCCNPAHLLLVK
jgi:hypothetical protein